VSSASTPGAAPSRAPLVIILTVVGVLAIIAAILYVSGAANSMHFLVGSVHKGHHMIRFIVSLVVGVAFLIGAYIARSKPAASGSGNTTGSGSTTGSTTSSPSTSGT
jgi:hypothetical protein